MIQNAQAWSNEEEQIILENCDFYTYKEIQERFLPNRTVESIRTHANKKMKIKKNVSSTRGWTDENINTLQKYYSMFPTSYIQNKYLTQFTEKQIMEYANILGLSKKESYIKNWKPQEVDLLLQNYSNSTIEELCNLIPSKTSNQIRSMAGALQLKKDELTYKQIMVSNVEKSLINSKPQQIIDELLDKLKIKNDKEYNIKYYLVDNYLPEHNLMIEVQGDYWHVSPLTFKKELSEKDKRHISRDKSKHTYIKNKYGIEVLYLWESDIKKNITLCEELIKKYVSSNGVLDNYHSFNYSISEKTKNLKLNNKKDWYKVGY